MHRTSALYLAALILSACVEGQSGVCTSGAEFTVITEIASGREGPGSVLELLDQCPEVGAAVIIQVAADSLSGKSAAETIGLAATHGFRVGDDRTVATAMANRFPTVDEYVRSTILSTLIGQLPDPGRLPRR